MDFIDEIKKIADRVEKYSGRISTEESTKQSLVLPFIELLGFDIYDPHEVCPEYTADVGLKKGEKVDYAILVDEKPVMLFECKLIHNDLSSEHLSQLYRYFSVTTAKIGVLTNGVKYKFYTDLQETNKLDSAAFLEIDLRKLEDTTLVELKKLTKEKLDLNNLTNFASELKYKKEIQNYIHKQFQIPSDEFVRFVGSKVFQGRMTGKVLQKFTDFTQKALRQFLNEEIEKRFSKALETPLEENSDSSNEVTEKIIEEKRIDPSIGKSRLQKEDSTIETTDEELEAFHLVRNLLSTTMDVDLIYYRDAQSYFAVLYEDNNRKQICRFHFNNLSDKKIEIFSNVENKWALIDNLQEIENYKQDLVARANELQEKPKT